MPGFIYLHPNFDADLFLCSFCQFNLNPNHDRNLTLKLFLTVSENWTCVVGFWQITTWSWFPIQPQRPTGPVATGWPRTTEKTGRHHQTFAQTCSNPLRLNVTDVTCLCSVSLSSWCTAVCTWTLRESKWRRINSTGNTWRGRKGDCSIFFCITSSLWCVVWSTPKMCLQSVKWSTSVALKDGCIS